MSPGAERARRVAAACAVAMVACSVALAPAAARVPGQFWLATLDMTRAWTVSEGAGVTVAVLDSGVVASVGDLAGRVLPGVDLSGGGGNGQSDPGEDCAGSGGCYSHGTDMALRIAGTGAGAGFQGLAPKANILPVKVTARSGQQSSPELISRGIRWAVDYGAQIINVSIGGDGLCPANEAEAAQYAYQHGVLVVATIGDKAISAEQSPSGCFGVLSVTATDVRFKPWSHSNYGITAAFTAAGVDVPVETVTGAIRQHTSSSDGAAAIVSGAFALIRAHFPTFGERALITRALWNVHTGGPPLGKQIDFRLGYGEILPYYAMTYPIPATATNPIFDRWQHDFGVPAVTGAPTAVPPSSAPPDSSSSPTSAPGSGPTNGGITINTLGAASGSASSTGLIIGLVAGLLVVLAIIGVVIRSRRGSRSV